MNHVNKRIFDDSTAGTRKVVLPWRRTLKMCAANVRHRLGRSILTFICIAVVVAFFASSMSYQFIINKSMKSDDVHIQAVLEKAGVFTHDKQSQAKQNDQRIWLMTLSAILCLVGITNTILMSVTERFREIGTLKCLGALNGFIVRIFLIENAFIGVIASLIGGIIGCLLAILQVGAAFEFSLLGGATFLQSFAASLPKAVGLGTVLTLLASLYPTYIASRMKPVDAMRVEV